MFRVPKLVVPIQLNPCVPVLSCMTLFPRKMCKGLPTHYAVSARIVSSCYNYKFMLFCDSHETLLALNRRYVGRPLHCVTTFAFFKTWVHLKNKLLLGCPHSILPHGLWKLSFLSGCQCRVSLPCWGRQHEISLSMPLFHLTPCKISCFFMFFNFLK